MSQPMIKPHQVDQLPFLDAQQKQNYKHGLSNLWQQLESSPEGSQQRAEARQKLLNASAKIMQQITQRSRPNAATAAAAAAGGTQQRPQSGQAGGQLQAVPQTQPAQPVQQPAQVQAQQQPQPQQPQPQQTTQQPQSDPDTALKARISQEVNAVIVAPAPDTTTEAQFQSYKQNFKTQLGTYRYKAEKAKENQAQIQRHFAQLQQNNQEPSAELKQRFLQVKAVVEQFTRSATGLIESNDRNMKAVQARKNQTQANRPTSTNGDQSGTPRPPTQQGIPVQQDGSPAQTQPVQNQPQRLPQVQNQQPQPTPSQQTPRPMSQPAQPAQPPQRPPLNPQAAQQYQSQYPASAIPQNANQQRPHALSQQGAIAKAQEQNFQQSANPQQAQAQPPQAPNGVGFNQPPPQSTPTSATPSQTQAPLNSRFPIPKTLNLGPQTQAPVAGPQPRPTMMGHGGMMGMPGIQKQPPFQLEGEGDHVLSKRKLDELVRQITGSTDPADGLTPDVEEAVLSLTDDFVDNVITKACQLAKLRQGQTLDIRDIQIVLERNYGIRIPGYALDEVRAVRKFQPGAGWIAKVQAVQAGKVMGSNRDA